MLHEVKTLAEAIEMLGGEQRAVTFINAEVRRRLYHQENNKSYRTAQRDDAKAFRELAKRAEKQGVALADILKQL